MSVVHDARVCVPVVESCTATHAPQSVGGSQRNGSLRCSWLCLLALLLALLLCRSRTPLRCAAA